MSSNFEPRDAAETVASLRFVHSGDLAPDGGAVVWCQSRIEGETETIDLLRTPMGESEPTTLVDTGSSTFPEHSPDGRTVAFLHAATDGVPQVAAVDLGTGTVRTLTSIPQGVASPPRWSPDGASIAFTAGPEAVDRSLPYRVTRAVGWRDGIGLVDDAINDIYVVDVDSGATVRLTHEDRLVECVEWRADSTGLTYLAGDGPDGWRFETSVRSVGFDGQGIEHLRSHEIFSLASSSEGFVLTTAGPTLNDDDTEGRLFSLSEGGAMELRSGELDVNGDIIADLPVPFADPQPRLFLHGDDVLVRVQVADRLEIHRIALRGAPSTRVEVATDGCAYPLALRGDLLLYASGDRLNAPDLRVLDLRTRGTTQVTHSAEHNARRLRKLRVETFWATADGGPRVQTTFMAPADTSGPLPTVLLIHGGPESTFGEALFLDAQLLCEAGLGVLLVNPRGSRGYGAAFLTAIRGDWGGIDADDLMAAVDLAVDRELADPDRLGVCGLSYGGYMTTWLIGQTDRFHAAVAENPVTNFLSLHGTSDIGATFTPQLMGGSMEKSIEQYLKSSPITNVGRVHTPTLLIVSEEDHRCPPEQALQFYARLRANGCEAELMMLPGASHDGAVHGGPATRRAQNEALVDWLASRLLDGAETASTSSGHGKGAR